MSGSLYDAPHDVNASSLLHARTVLCVQPKLNNQQFLRQALDGYRPVMVDTAFEAIRCNNHSAFDAYILDYWLPDWSGSALCREIRKADPHSPIVFYTSFESGDATRALSARATAFIRAPIDSLVLRERLRVLIERADIHDLHARLEEERAIHDELQRRASAAVHTAEQAMRRARAAIEQSAKIKAAKAFIDAGGTRAGFERFWPKQFAAVCARETLT
ncbi:MAG: response regulator [Burkholderiales bacterium]